MSKALAHGMCGIETSGRFCAFGGTTKPPELEEGQAFVQATRQFLRPATCSVRGR